VIDARLEYQTLDGEWHSIPEVTTIGMVESEPEPESIHVRFTSSLPRWPVVPQLRLRLRAGSLATVAGHPVRKEDG
jgi:hypothetical protein